MSLYSRFITSKTDDGLGDRTGIASRGWYPGLWAIPFTYCGADSDEVIAQTTRDGYQGNPLGRNHVCDLPLPPRDAAQPRLTLPAVRVPAAGATVKLPKGSTDDHQHEGVFMWVICRKQVRPWLGS